MGWLIQQLEDLRYKWAYRVLDTLAFGLPQRRRRVYLIASQTDDPAEMLFSDWVEPNVALVPSLEKPIGFFWTEGRSGVGLTSDGVPPLKAGSGLGIPSMPAVLFEDGGVRVPGVRTCEALQGFPLDWTEQSDPSLERARWRLVGNAVSIPVATWVASRFGSERGRTSIEESPIANGAAWPNAAFNIGKGRFAAEPKHVRRAGRPSLESFRQMPWTALSQRALGGFIQRAEKGSLKFPIGFLDKLHTALQLGSSQGGASQARPLTPSPALS